MKKVFNFLKFLLQILPLVIVCFISDYLLKNVSWIIGHHSSSKHLKAICDNAGHGMSAACAWLIIIDFQCVCNRWDMFITGFCGCLSSMIDIDHFLVARSFTLEEALSLSIRPPFHNTSFIVIFLLPIHGSYLLLKPTFDTKWHDLVLSLWAGVLTHHLRDANRRGLWLWPMGNTRPLSPFPVYITAILMVICVIKLIRNHYFVKENKSIENVEVARSTTVLDLE